MKRGATAKMAAAFVTLGLALSGCSAVAAEGPTVVVTTNILGDITRNLVGGEAVVVLMESDADPHSFGISAKQAAVIENADLVIHNGAGLEEGMLDHMEAAAAEGVPTLAAMEAVEPEIEPCRRRRRHRPAFLDRPLPCGLAADAMQKAAWNTWTAWTARWCAPRRPATRRNWAISLPPWRKVSPTSTPARRKLLTNHHVFGYLAHRFGFEVVGAVIPSGTTLASPSSADLNDLTGKIQAAGVVAIFADSSQPERLAQVLAAEAGQDIAVVPLFTESLGTEGSGAHTYLEMMRSNTERITHALS